MRNLVATGTVSFFPSPVLPWSRLELVLLVHQYPCCSEWVFGLTVTVTVSQFPGTDLGSFPP